MPRSLQVRQESIKQVKLAPARCRLVTMLGMGGIGKTALAAKVAAQVQHEFEYVIWEVYVMPHF